MQFWLRSREVRPLACIALLALVLAVGCGEDGQDAASSLIEESEADQEDCEHGGVVFTAGIDETGDGEIDEQTERTVVCHGPPGADADDGEEGDSGTDALVTTTEEEPGENCQFGGVRVDVGTDADGSGELGEDEIEDTQYFCNDNCATGEPLQFDIAIDELPDRFVEYFTYEVSVDTDADVVDVLAYDPSQNSNVDVDYDDEDETLTFEHLEGEEATDLMVMATDGCDITIEGVRLGPWEEPLADVYVAHMAGDIGEVDIVETNDDETVGTIDTYEFAGPIQIEFGDYEFDLVDDEGDVIATTPQLELDPFDEELVVAYSDDGETEFELLDVDTTEPPTGEVRVRASHLAEDEGQLDVHLVDNSSLLFEEMAFSDFSDSEEFTANADGMLGLDTDDDGDADIDFMTSVGAFSPGNNVEVFLVEDGGDIWAVIGDYESGDAELHDPNLVAYPSYPNATIGDGGQSHSDTVTVSGCDTVDSLNMDIDADHGAYTLTLTVYLENPEGDEYALWSEGASVGTSLTGNFNETIDADAGTTAYESDVEEIDIFEGSDGNGDWTATVLNDSCCSDATFDFWQLNLSCSED